MLLLLPKVLQKFFSNKQIPLIFKVKQSGFFI